MSDYDRNYFVAAGKSLEMLEKVIQDRRECNRKRDEFTKRIGAKTYLICSGGFEERAIAGFVFDGEPPPKWKRIKRDAPAGVAGYLPPNRTKKDKALWREMRDELTWPSVQAIAQFHMEGRYVYFGTVEKLGEKYVLSQHKNAQPPQDAIPLLRSEYWRMREAAEKPKGEAA